MDINNILTTGHVRVTTTATERITTIFLTTIAPRGMRRDTNHPQETTGTTGAPCMRPAQTALRGANAKNPNTRTEPHRNRSEIALAAMTTTKRNINHNLIERHTKKF